MQLYKKIILLLLILGFSGIQFVSFIDDPQHQAEPDPDCFFCMVSQTSICVDHSVNIDFTPDIISYIIEYAYQDPYSHHHFSNISTRAPPFI